VRTVIALGRLVARGRTSDVHAYGADCVVKVPRPGVPEDWPAIESRLTAAVHALGVPVPQVRDLVAIDGRYAIVFERIDGPSMWQRILRRPPDAEALGRELAATHRTIQAAGLTSGIEGFVARTHAKIAAVDLEEAERDEARCLASSLPCGAALLHGDLHPGNVLMSPRGPVVIDWFDAAIGHPTADVIRSSILLRPSSVPGGSPHLPGADRSTMLRVHDAYLDEMADQLVESDEQLGRWESVIAVSRLAERAQPDEESLRALWRRRGSAASPVLAAAHSRSREGSADDSLQRFEQ
jgi:aminoglycoside phosphotransferase (APT) family kinase protein